MSIPRLGLSILILSAWMTSVAFAGAAESPCAQIVLAGKGIQVIPIEGAVMTKVKVEDGIACGSMVITHQDPLWIKLSNQTTVKIAPDSFVELAPSMKGVFKLLRGEVLLNSPNRQGGDHWSSPNAEMDFNGGVAWFQYLPKVKKSTAACFNRNLKFFNKFNHEAAQEVRAGEMSSLAIQEARVRPTMPAVMSHHSAEEALKRMSLPAEEVKQLVSVIQQVFEDRGTALASEIEEWEESEVPSGTASRSIASVPQAGKNAVDEKEAEFTMMMLKRKLYGDPKEVAQVENQRAPASLTQKSEPFADIERDTKEKKFRVEVKKIGRQIERISPAEVD